MQAEMITEATRLITLKIDGARKSGRNSEVDELMRKLIEPDFREVVLSVAEGMDVTLIEIPVLNDIVFMSKSPDSLFAPSLSDLKTGGLSVNAYMIIVLGVVAAFFPSTDSMDSYMDGESGRSSLEVAQALYSFCEGIKERSEDSTGQYKRVVDEILMMSSVSTDPNKRSEDTLQTHVRNVLRQFVEVGYLNKRDTDSGEHYTVRPLFPAVLMHYGLMCATKLAQRIEADLVEQTAKQA